LDFNLPTDLVAYLDELDRFIAREIKPLEEADDNIRFFDHRREWARTDFENGGLPRREWELLLRKAKDLADKAGHLRFAIPKRYGGKDGSNLWMAVIREHFAAKGLGLHNDLQNEHSIVGNLPLVTMLDRYGSAEQKAMIEGSIAGKYRITFGLTEPEHGSDATHMETRAVPATRDNVKGWLINGEKMWTTGMHVATHCALFARTSGNDGDARGITCFLVPARSDGVKVEQYMWTFNMPTDHPRVSFSDVFVPEDALFGEVGRGLSLAQCFVHENRIRQAASSLGAAPCRCMAAWAIRDTSRSSTSTAITVATASPKAARKSRCERSRASCSAIWEPASDEAEVADRLCTRRCRHGGDGSARDRPVSTQSAATAPSPAERPHDVRRVNHPSRGCRKYVCSLARPIYQCGNSRVTR